MVKCGWCEKDADAFLLKWANEVVDRAVNESALSDLIYKYKYSIPVLFVVGLLAGFIIGAIY